MNAVLQLGSVTGPARKKPSGFPTGIGKPGGDGNGNANGNANGNGNGNANGNANGNRNGKCATASQPSMLLTAREIEVLRLIAAGLNNAQIAKRLSISPHTVQAHVRSMYAKTNVSSRNAVAHYAAAHKLL
jgi:DNA-binding CsgD family transcriptional regulator